MRAGLIAYLQRHAVGLLALFVALGGTSYAVTSKRFVGRDGRVSVCVQKQTGTLRMVVAGKRCRRGEQRVSWNQRGRVGAQGAPGPAGSIQGAPAGGDLSGSYPAPTIAAAGPPVDVADNPNTATDPCAPPAPQTLVLCGTSSNHFNTGGFGIPGLQVWRDRIGQVHIRGSATVTTALNNTHPILFVLPPDLRPPRLIGIPVATGQSAGAHVMEGALLVVDPSGFVGVFTQTTDQVVHVGDVAFRTDS